MNINIRNNLTNNKTIATLGFKLYLVATVFALLNVFNQSVQLGASEHFEHTINASTTTIVYLFSTFLITYSIMQIPGGIILDKYGPKFVLPAGIIISSIAFITLWYAKSSTSIVIARMIGGFGCSVSYITGIYIANKFFSHKKLALLVGVLEAVSTTGSLMSARPLDYLVNTFGWNTIGYVMIICAIVYCIISVYYSYKLWQLEHLFPKNNIKPIAVIIKDVIDLFKNKNLIYIFLYSFCTWMIIMSFAGFWLKEYLLYMHNMAKVLTLNLVSVYWLSFFISGIILGLFLIKYNNLILILRILAMIGFITYAFMSIPVLFSTNLLIFVFILAGCSASGVIITFALIPEFSPPQVQGTAVAINNTFIVLGGYFGQILIGMILKNHSSFHTERLHAILTNHNVSYQYYIILLLYIIVSFLGFILSMSIKKKTPNCVVNTPIITTNSENKASA